MIDEQATDRDLSGLDPRLRSAYHVLGALDAETDALDHLLLRCRATMLLASAGELTHLERASGDLDAAASSLDAVSGRRHEAVAEACRVWGASANTAAELVDAAPEEFREDFARRLDVQRGLLAEASEAVTVATELAKRSLELLGERRQALSNQAGPPLTYGSPGHTPPAVVHQLA